MGDPRLRVTMGEGSLLNLPVVNHNHNRNLKSKEEKIDGRSTIESHDERGELAQSSCRES